MIGSLNSKVVEGGWNDEIDLSSDSIYEIGEHIGSIYTPLREAFGRNLAKARERRGYTQRTLAEKTSLMQADICKMEKGKGNPTLATMQKLSKVLRVSVSSLLRLS